MHVEECRSQGCARKIEDLRVLAPIRQNAPRDRIDMPVFDRDGRMLDQVAAIPEPFRGNDRAHALDYCRQAERVVVAKLAQRSTNVLNICVNFGPDWPCYRSSHAHSGLTPRLSPGRCSGRRTTVCPDARSADQQAADRARAGRSAENQQPADVDRDFAGSALRGHDQRGLWHGRIELRSVSRRARYADRTRLQIFPMRER